MNLVHQDSRTTKNTGAVHMTVAVRDAPRARVSAESERASELGAALAGSPPRGAFDLRDPRHFPPMRAAPAPAPAAPAAALAAPAPPSQ